MANIPGNKEESNTIGFIKAINDAIARHVELIASIGALVVGIAAYNATLEAARIQGNAALEAANVQADAAVKAATSVKSYVDGVNLLLNPENASEPNNANNVRIVNPLTANVFAALRDLEGKDKGTFIRFLHEKKLITNQQPQVLLAGADLREINLRAAWLPDINLEGAYILKSKLYHTSLKRANLRRADLTAADLTGADLTAADLTGADLTGANLTGAKVTDLSGAILCRTTLPNGKKSKSECPQ